MEDGTHVYSGQAYAEIEVMKMVMTLTTQESGVVHHVKRSGAVLEAGTVLARLDLDDPTRVHRAELFTKGFDALDEDSESQLGIATHFKPNSYNSKADDGSSGISSSGSASDGHNTPNESKLNVTFIHAKTHLENVLAGFGLPEPFFTQYMNHFVEKFMDCLRDPRLPLLELQDIISSTSGRIPSQVEKSIRKLMNNYSSNESKFCFSY